LIQQFEPAVVRADAEPGRAVPTREHEKASLSVALSNGSPDEHEKASGSVQRIRHSVAVLRASEERVGQRLTELNVEKGRLRTELDAAQAQVKSAEAMIAFQAARADVAEQRCRDTEVRFVRMLNSFADELEASGSLAL
jgi:hypothetical protein